MAEVIVPPGSRGLIVRACGAPAATATTIVSPIARLVARISAATMPEIAAGNTTRSEVVILRAPRPYEASRRFWGTARIASSATDATRGIDRIPTPSPAAARLNELASSNRGLMTIGVEERQGEEPQDDAGNARQDLEDRLDGPPEAGRGVLGQVDRREEADGRRDQHGDHRDDQRSRSRWSVTSKMPRRGNHPMPNSWPRSICDRKPIASTGRPR